MLLRFVIQRTKRARVVIDGASRGEFERGLMILLGVGAFAADAEDSAEFNLQSWQDTLEKCVEKILGLRIFEDSEGKMNLSVRDIAGGVYLVSQFTLFADVKKGFRPSFTRAAKPDVANALYEKIKKRFEELYRPVHSGVFGAHMDLEFINDGPVTIIFDADSRGLL